MSPQEFESTAHQEKIYESEAETSQLTETLQLSRKEREKERHRQDVFQTAEMLLTRKSYREITMQEIAAETEFSVGYLYRLFPNKESIFISLLRHKHESLMTVIEKNLQAPLECEKRLSNVVYAIFAWLNENMVYATSSLRDLHALAHTHAGMSSDWLRYQKVMRERFEAFFNEAIQEGTLTEEEPHLISKTLRAIMWGFLREGLLYEGGKKDWTEDAPTVVRIMMKAFSPEKGQKKNESA